MKKAVSPSVNENQLRGDLALQLKYDQFESTFTVCKCGEEMESQEYWWSGKTSRVQSACPFLHLFLGPSEMHLVCTNTSVSTKHSQPELTPSNYNRVQSGRENPSASNPKLWELKSPPPHGSREAILLLSLSHIMSILSDPSVTGTFHGHHCDSCTRCCSLRAPQHTRGSY